MDLLSAPGGPSSTEQRLYSCGEEGSLSGVQAKKLQFICHYDFTIESSTIVLIVLVTLALIALACSVYAYQKAKGDYDELQENIGGIRPSALRGRPGESLTDAERSRLQAAQKQITITKIMKMFAKTMYAQFKKEF